MAQDLLFEIGTAELPPKLLLSLVSTLSENIKNGLEKSALKHGTIHYYATPRRLAVIIKDLAEQQPNRLIEKRGPALKAAYDAQNKPTQACIGFAQSCGVSVEQLSVQETDKGSWLIFSQLQPGKKTTELLPEILSEAITKLPIPKPMRWGNHAIEFIRPVYWVALIFGNKIIPAEILGQATSNKTYGHRFYHPHPLTLTHAQDYVDLLKTKARVIADYEIRKSIIREQLNTIVQEKGEVIIDEDLLDEVTSLVEWPVALLAEFNPTYLDVPAEALILAMKHHQKCFAIVNEKQQLQPYFITISNIESKNPQRVIEGNQRVIHARLADAQFFYQTDLKQPLTANFPSLEKVIFQKQLGSIYDKALRIAKLAIFMAKQIKINETNAERAALLAKTDLVSNMVTEFPELQGIMGSYYAKAYHEPEEVVNAIREHYLPRFAGDKLPDSLLGCIIAIADRIDTLIGIFGINQIPTGEKDPYGLRRAALGVLRIIIEKRLHYDLNTLLEQAKNNFQYSLVNQNVHEQTLHFMMERLRAYYQEQEISAEIFNAVLARKPTCPLDFDQRIHAVQHFQALTQAASLTAANKRVSNILKKIDNSLENIAIDHTLLIADAEKQLAQSMNDKKAEIDNLVNQAKYTEVLTSLASLQKPVDEFFDKVMVMVEDKPVRNNRLAMLYHLRNLFLQVADISLLQ